MKRRKTALFIMILLIVLITACGKVIEKEEISSETIQEHPEIENKDTEVKITNTTTPYTIKVSNVKATIPYLGNKFIKSIFCTGSDRIYVCGVKPEGNFFLGGMKSEENKLTEFPIAMPENQRIINMTVDKQGISHLLWMSVEKVTNNGDIHNKITFEKSYIMVLNSSGEVENNLDVTDLFLQEQNRPYCFITDQEGNYYFDKNKEIIKLDSNGKLITTILCDGYVTAIGCGKSGIVYCTYLDEQGI